MSRCLLISAAILVLSGSPSLVRSQNILYLDGSTLPPDSDPAIDHNPTPPEWDWYNTNPYPQSLGFPADPPVGPYNTSQTPLGIVSTLAAF